MNIALLKGAGKRISTVFRSETNLSALRLVIDLIIGANESSDVVLSHFPMLSPSGYKYGSNPLYDALSIETFHLEA